MKHNEEHSTAKRNKVTQLQFYSYRLAARVAFSPVFHGGKLFQQYIVDSYVRTEAARLEFIRRNQSNLRVELYQGLMDHLQSQAEQQNLNPGKVFILPSSFHGSPRAMQQNYQDAMAIVAKHGKPDLFLTFTCNPRCKDILDNLPQGQRPDHRPDIVARVFQLHLKELLLDITKRHVLGKPVAHLHVIEFQKRGLPHAHMLIMLSAQCQINTPGEIDHLICAEIPDPVNEPDLHAVVKSTMVHGPCGCLNKSSVCMVDGKCSKDFPKDFRESTAFALNGYPHYRRRDNGRTIAVGSHEVDNRWIVPYNPYLTQKFNAHINIEACTTIKSVKYLFKYVYKGHDCANIKVTAKNELTHDEIETFLDARYVSAPEAFWRLSEYRLHDKSHTIIRLPLHLPRQQPVYFTTGEHEAALEEARNHVPGPKSFLDLRTFEGQTVTTYKEACMIRDLLTDDTEWDRCLSEAGAFHMPSQLRSLFATICLYCEPSDPLSLWLAHKNALCEDFVHVHGLNNQEAENKCLGEIQNILQQSSFLCSDFGLPAVEIVSHRDCFDLHQEQQVVDENMALLNEEQMLIVDEILQALQEIDQTTNAKCRAYFLDGPG
jgi:hypothetical protein